MPLLLKTGCFPKLCNTFWLPFPWYCCLFRCIGVSILNVTELTAQDDVSSGILVQAVSDGSPAASAGVIAGESGLRCFRWSDCLIRIWRVFDAWGLPAGRGSGNHTHRWGANPVTSPTSVYSSGTVRRPWAAPTKQEVRHSSLWESPLSTT